jgi:hypothetical protein
MQEQYQGATIAVEDAIIIIRGLNLCGTQCILFPLHDLPGGGGGTNLSPEETQPGKMSITPTAAIRPSEQSTHVTGPVFR